MWSSFKTAQAQIAVVAAPALAFQHCHQVTQLHKLFALDPNAWSREADLTEEYFGQFGDRVPEELYNQLDLLRDRIATS